MPFWRFRFSQLSEENFLRLWHIALRLYGVQMGSGVVERRPYIKTDILMDGITKNIELTLTDRGPMDYTMLIGRKALGRRWIVNPSISFITKPNGNKK